MLDMNTKRLHLFSSILLTLLAHSAVLALAAEVTPSSQSLETQADERYRSKDWPAASSAYAALVAKRADSGMAHFRLGVAELHLGHLDRGLAELESAEKLGGPVPQIAYWKACANAAAGRADRAITELERASAAGFAQTTALDDEPLLSNLRSDSRWPALRKRIDSAAHPCRYDSRYRAFDFWIGEWDVRPAGAPETTPPAENVITLEYDECVVHEHWKSANSSGESFNVYDASREQWFQTWVDNTGGLHQYHGNPDRQGNMVFLTDLQYTPGKERVPTRLTFFKLGADKVRQFSEQSSDGGKTWTVNYDLIYLRRANHRGSLRMVERSAVLSALERYRAAWLVNDREAVLRTFTDDPVLIPVQGGSRPVVGKDAIVSYWWPATGPATRIVAFEQQVERADGEGNFAAAYGFSKVEWVAGATSQVQSSRSQWTAVLRKGADGEWRIGALAWAVTP